MSKEGGAQEQTNIMERRGSLLSPTAVRSDSLNKRVKPQLEGAILGGGPPFYPRSVYIERELRVYRGAWGHPRKGKFFVAGNLSSLGMETASGGTKKREKKGDKLRQEKSPLLPGDWSS